MKARSRAKVAKMTVPFPGTSPGPLATDTPHVQSCPRANGFCPPEVTKTLIRVKTGEWADTARYLSASPASYFFSFLVNFSATI